MPDVAASLLLASGRDRPGLVDRISGVLFDVGCNLEDSRMAILGGEFALMVLFTGARDRLERAETTLRALAGEMDLLVQVKPAAEPSPHARAGLPFQLHVVAMDHPGIVHKITHLLNEQAVNVARLDTAISHAPVSGTPVFSLDLEAWAPPEVALSNLRAALSALAAAENIDIDLRAGD